MAFGRAKVHQMNLLTDRYYNLPKKMRRYVDESWAPEFYDQVTCKVNQDRFEVLYSDNPATRPSAPVPQIIGALIIKEMFGLTDEELLENIMTNITYQYALGLTSAEDIPFSDRTFGRFRARLNEYQAETGIDLIQQEQEDIAVRFCGLLGISGKKKRMDSLMIDSRGKYMTRLEIIHTTNANAVKTLLADKLPDDLKHYLEKDDRNKVIYHQKDEELGPKLQMAVYDAFRIRDLMEQNELSNLPEYRILVRMIGDQTTEEGELRDKKDIKPDSLQNPNDPDATYRFKAGNQYHGYAGNVAQAYNGDGASIIVKADYEQNTYSDTQFMKDYIDGKEDTEEETMITDAAFQSAENDKAAEEAGINHKTTSLTGKKVDPIVTQFNWDEGNDTVTGCPKGFEPLKQSTYKNGTTHRLIFDRKDCNPECPFYDRCHAKEQKNTTVVTIDTGSIERAEQQKKLETEEYKQAARERNAVEGVPSVLRRRYNVDNIPVFGKERSKVFFRFKIIACNVVSLIRHLPQTRDHCAQNAVLA
ncbi:MAG: transposase [Solobacterium sp.]|nr:transposase [Solobacterium sp.]